VFLILSIYAYNAITAGTEPDWALSICLILITTPQAINLYNVEVKIPFRTMSPEVLSKIGFDCQVNDDIDGAATRFVNIWSDTFGGGYGNTSKWGELTLVNVLDQQSNTINENNHPPVITTIPAITVTAGQTATFTVNATDADNNNITLSSD